MNPYVDTTNELRKIPAPVNMYKRRFPNCRINSIKTKLPQLSTIPRIITVASDWIGLLYALKICIMYGRIAFEPVKCVITKSDTMMKNGFKVLLRFNSANFSAKVGNACEHWSSSLIHNPHDFERSLWRCSSLNSWATKWPGTQPRSQRSEFSACSVRFFESSHWGVSGTCGNRRHCQYCGNFASVYSQLGIFTLWNWTFCKKNKSILTKLNANAEVIGIIKPTRAIDLHGKNAFKM